MGLKSRKPLIEKGYGILAKPITLENPTSNAILERIHLVQGNLLWKYSNKDTYIDEDYPWSGILIASAFEIISTENRLKGYSPVQLLFSRDMIPPIKHTED